MIGKYFDSKFSSVSFSTPIKAKDEPRPTNSLPNRASSYPPETKNYIANTTQ